MVGQLHKSHLYHHEILIKTLEQLEMDGKNIRIIMNLGQVSVKTEGDFSKRFWSPKECQGVVLLKCFPVNKNN